MICDGYTQHGSVGGLHFSYRPSLAEERDVVLEMLGFHSKPRLVTDYIRRHVWWSDRSIETLPSEIVEAMFFVCLGVARPESGGDWCPEWEHRDAKNLYDGVLLELTHPKVASRDCEDCQKWWYDEESGKIVRRSGFPIKRPLNVLTVCQTNEGCPKGSPEDQKTLSKKNRLAWKAYREWRAVGEFPDDHIVRRNAFIIEKAIADAERFKQKARVLNGRK